MKKRFIMLFLIVIFLVVILALNISYILPYRTDKKWSNLTETRYEKETLNFIKNKMSKKGYGIYTNYLDKSSEGDITKGHDVLSESEGLIMIYAVEQGNKELFDEHYKIIKESMIIEDNLIGWRKGENGVTNTSATIDDLRIIKALLYGADRWKVFEYKKEAIKISKGIIKNCISNDNIIDFKDNYGKSENTTICYLDLKAMKMLSQLDWRWKKIYNNAHILTESAFISKDLPLYRTVFNHKNKDFVNEKDTDTLLSFLVILNRAQIGEDVKISIKWIKEKINSDGAIYSKYNIQDGNASTDIQSTAIYSLGALIGDEIGDKELSRVMMDKLLKYQIKDKNHQLYGAFGNESTLEVYSFDNLNALLALQKR